MEKRGGARNRKQNVIPLTDRDFLLGQVAELRVKFSISSRVSLLLLSHNSCMRLKKKLLGYMVGWTVEVYVRTMVDQYGKEVSQVEIAMK